jgi:hypothetical protein
MPCNSFLCCLSRTGYTAADMATHKVLKKKLEALNEANPMVS